MTTLSIARPRPAAPPRARHRAPSAHALQLRHTWTPRRTLGGLLGAAAENYLMHVVLWVALVGLLGFALVLDAHAAYGMAALTGFFRRRPVDEPAAAQPPADAASTSSSARPPSPADAVVAAAAVADAAVARAAALRPDRPIVSDDPLVGPGSVPAVPPALERTAIRRPVVDDELDVPRFAGPGETPPPERTDRIPVVRREQPARNVGDPYRMLERIAALEDELAERDRLLDRGIAQMRELERALRDAELDRDEADRSAETLRRALERVAAPAPAVPWPYTEAEQNRPAELADLDAEAERLIESLARLVARRDLELAGVDRPSDVMAEHYRHVAADIINAGWRPPRGQAPAPRARRAALGRVLVDHARKDAGTCRCGWSQRGATITHAEHVAETLLATEAAR